MKGQTFVLFRVCGHRRGLLRPRFSQPIARNDWPCISASPDVGEKEIGEDGDYAIDGQQV